MNFVFTLECQITAIQSLGLFCCLQWITVIVSTLTRESHGIKMSRISDLQTKVSFQCFFCVCVSTHKTCWYSILRLAVISVISKLAVPPWGWTIKVHKNIKIVVVSVVWFNTYSVLFWTLGTSGNVWSNNEEAKSSAYAEQIWGSDSRALQSGLSWPI